MGMEARDRNTMALAALRISVGMLFLIFGDYKVFDAEFIWRGGFQIWINRFLTDGADRRRRPPALRRREGIGTRDELADLNVEGGKHE
jgi:hypothetical protein